MYTTLIIDAIDAIDETRIRIVGTVKGDAGEPPLQFAAPFEGVSVSLEVVRAAATDKVTRIVAVPAALTALPVGTVIDLTTPQDDAALVVAGETSAPAVKA